MASRRKITKTKRRNKRVKNVIRSMRENGKHVNRKLKKDLRCR